MNEFSKATKLKVIDHIVESLLFYIVLFHFPKIVVRKPNTTSRFRHHMYIFLVRFFSASHKM